MPCHRRVGAGGRLVGFGGGLPRKVYLLELEARVALQQAWS
ncbi:6-O-methylguanine DNA methyltransferase-like protein [Micromonospora taraxaci]|uniref:6-O-methylguanine DNA methyltransferase-like protein n=1 Tax=Micromonospora taraxaci TaxID=1316803 RepID=A0A561VTS1_9ACTN|nr:6-O-methylguanine DNA methyltransferase-like protein [Micromonospora taraxaci]